MVTQTRNRPRWSTRSTGLLLPVGFMWASEARERMGVSVRTFSNRIKSEGIELFKHPGDERLRLLRREDFERLETPRRA